MFSLPPGETPPRRGGGLSRRAAAAEGRELLGGRCIALLPRRVGPNQATETQSHSENGSIADVSHELMSFGTLPWLPVPQVHGRNGVLGGLRNLRRCVTAAFSILRLSAEVILTAARQRNREPAEVCPTSVSSIRDELRSVDFPAAGCASCRTLQTAGRLVPCKLTEQVHKILDLPTDGLRIAVPHCQQD